MGRVDCLKPGSRPPTRVEFVVLDRLADNQSPWGKHGIGGSSRKWSQALSRLQRLGYAEYTEEGADKRPTYYRITPAGEEARQRRGR